ncbi:unnamed protein product [Miscanthus lutarioriparius]|uniref:Uncharacterized protein n=1 Tax=Miscanthus lutarioriparius TaxID=422564 RepID=A0A811RRZ8_9POAL|nr:unnamed protein product [Miscanthus lutarioriparius]
MATLILLHAPSSSCRKGGATADLLGRPDLTEVDNAPGLTGHDQASVNAGLPIGPSVRVHTLIHGIYTMKKLNKHNYPIGKRMQQVGIIISALVMGTLGFQVPIESGHQLITQIVLYIDVGTLIGKSKSGSRVPDEAHITDLEPP